MNDGVALLLERMKTNPEEFNGEINKWGNLILYYKDYLDPEDADALNTGINKLLQQRFTEKVMEELVDPKKSSLKDIINQYQVKGMPSVGTTRGLYSNGIGGNATLLAQQQLQTEHMKAHIEALRAEDRTKLLNKKPTTIFGRLFNYQ